MADRQASEQYPEAYEVNMKSVVDEAQVQQAHGRDQSQQQASIMFYTVLGQNIQAFNQAIQAQAKLTDISVQAIARAAHDGQTISQRAAQDGQSVSVKELDPDVAEVAEGSIMARIAAIEEALIELQEK